MKQLITRLYRSEQAVALIEFAITLPVLVLLLFGSIEVARYMMIVQRVEKTAYSMTNMVAQFMKATPDGGTGQISNTAMQGVFNQFHRLMQPFGRGGPGAVTNGIVSFDSVIHIASSNKNFVRWERTGGGTCADCETRPPSIVVYPAVSGTMDHRFSTTPGTFYNCPDARFNAHYSSLISGMLDNENFIVGQVHFYYEPLLNRIGTFRLPARMISRAIFIHPRNGDLLDADPAFVAPTERQGRCNNA